jgi:hypothetical protein
MSTAEIYLSRGLALVRSKTSEVAVRAWDPSTPLGDALRELDDLVPRGATLTLHLSAGLCPAILVNYPHGLTRFNERQVFARSIAANQLGVSISDILCEADPMRGNPWAALPVGLLETINTWSSLNASTLISLRPLWSVVSESSRVRSADGGVLIMEPDALTLLGPSTGFTVPLAAGTLEDQVETRAAGMFESLDLPVEGRVRLRLSGQPGSGPVGGPSIWRQHWSDA